MRSSFVLSLLALLVPACPGDAPATSASDSGDVSTTDTTGDSADDSTAGPTTVPTTGADGGDGPVDLVCDLMREACERQVECGHALVNNNPGGVEACLAEQRCESVGDLLALPNLELDPAAVEACIAALAAASCGELAAQGLEIDARCSQYVVGTLGEGEACHGGIVSDCAPDLACEFEDGACPGTCVVPPAPCHEGSCGADAFCAADGACEPRVALGEACDETTVGFGNLSERVCAAGGHCQDSVCVADLGPGAPCSGQDVHACGDGACMCADPDDCDEDADLTCNPVRVAGEPCSSAFECADGLFCDFYAGSRCTARAQAGAACNDSFGACVHPLVCVDGTCGDEPADDTEVPLLAEGDPCVDGGACPLGTACTCDDGDCQDKHCAAAPGLGESCEAQDFDGFSCSAGLCDVLASRTCVLPGAAGEPCPVDGLTFACASLVCIDGECASMEQTRCEA